MDKTFYIKRGRHYSRPFFFKLLRKYGVYKFRVIFDGENWYPSNAVEHTGINKWFGWAMIFHGEKILGKIPFIRNLVNSFLIGWQPDFYNEGKMDLYCYGDIRGKEFREYFATIRSDRTYEIEIGLFKDNKWITIDGVEVYRKCYYTPRFGYFLKPYFGGRSRAPHLMFFPIKSTLNPIIYFMLILTLTLFSCQKDCANYKISFYDADTNLVKSYEARLCDIDKDFLEGTPQDFFLWQAPDTLLRSWRRLP